MKKLLLGTAAVALVAGYAVPAQAQVELSLGGVFKGYLAYSDQEDHNTTSVNTTDTDPNDFDILRETEIHFSGETTLDNGLTVGAHFEADLDNGTNTTGDEFDTEEAYVYWSGTWGRVNFGKEDGVAYLLQVSAPSADSNVDGLRMFINPVNYTDGGTDSIMPVAATAANHGAAADDAVSDFNALLTGNFGVDSQTTALTNDLANGAVLYAPNVADGVAAGEIVITDVGYLNYAFSDLGRVDYDLAVSGFDNKLTYLSPVFSGFQVGLSYTPELSDATEVTNTYESGVELDDQLNDFGASYGIAARYEGQFDQLGVAFGVGYETADVEEEGTLQGIYYSGGANNNITAAEDTLVTEFDDREAWNVGLDLDWGPFGLGFAYIADDLGFDEGLDRDTWVLGADYTTGPFKFGLSYLSQNQELDAIFGNGLAQDADNGLIGDVDMDIDRITGGVVYTYGPGMTFRGSVSYIEYDGSELDLGATDDLSADSVDVTSVLVGTQIRF